MRSGIGRRHFLAGAALAGGVAGSRRAWAAEKLTLGIVNTISDAPFFIADAKGFFTAEGLDVELTTFASGSTMIAPLGAGQLDIGAGALSVAFFNAIEHGVSLRIVADKARNAPGYGFQALMIRAGLIDGGQFKDFADLKGLKICIPSRASVGEQSILNEAAKRGGLDYDAVEKMFLPTNEQLPALRNGAVDGTIVSEPTVSLSIQSGATKLFAKVDSFYPNQEAAVLYFGDTMLNKRPELTHRFMRAYLRALRWYNDSLSGGHIAGANAEEAIDIIARYAVTKDRALIRAATPSGVDPDGAIEVASIAKDLGFVQGLGMVNKSFDVARSFDFTAVQKAAAELGPYRKA